MQNFRLFFGNKTVYQRSGANLKNVFFAKICCQFLVFLAFCRKKLKMIILTSIWSAQHPNAGPNLQHHTVTQPDWSEVPKLENKSAENSNTWWILGIMHHENFGNLVLALGPRIYKMICSHLLKLSMLNVTRYDLHKFCNQCDWKVGARPMHASISALFFIRLRFRLRSILLSPCPNDCPQKKTGGHLEFNF